MLTQSILVILASLLHSHLPYIISHQEHLSSFMQLYNRMTKHVLAFPYPVTVSKHQDHHIVEFRSV